MEIPFALDLAGPIAVDTETTGLYPWQGDCPFAVSMCDAHGATWYCQWPVNPHTREVCPDKGDLEIVRGVIEDDRVHVVMHNAKFDIRMLDINFGMKLRGRLDDTLIAAKIANSNEPRYGLKPLAEKYFMFAPEDQSDLQDATIVARRRGKALGYTLGTAVEEDYWLPSHFDPSNALCQKYAVGDVERTILLWLMYREVLDTEGVRALYEHEITLWHLCYKMERRGICVNKARCEEEIAKARAVMARCVDTMVALAGRSFNVNSDAQLARILYTDFDLQPLLSTDNGNPSTSWDAIEPYRETHPFIDALLEYRANEKSINTFFQKYLTLAVPDEINPCGHCIHTTLKQEGTRTGRFSSADPNLQQTDKPDGKNAAYKTSARVAFGPRPGYLMYCIDYSQVELVMFADAAQEPFLLDAWNSGRDMHAETANRAWGGEINPAGVLVAIRALELDQKEPRTPELAKAWEVVGWPNSANRALAAAEWLAHYDYDIVAAEKSLGKKTSRSRAKNLNFAKIYGGGPKAAQAFIKCSYEEARRFVDDYDTAFPGIAQFITSYSRRAALDGFIINRYGRKIIVVRDESYKSVNYLIQSSAADLMKRAMVKCNRFLVDTGLDAHLIMTVHDELVFEIRKEHAYKWLLRKLCEIMRDHEGAFTVALEVECSRVRENWADKEVVKL